MTYKLPFNNLIEQKLKKVEEKITDSLKTTVRFIINVVSFMIMVNKLSIVVSIISPTTQGITEVNKIAKTNSVLKNIKSQPTLSLGTAIVYALALSKTEDGFNFY